MTPDRLRLPFAEQIAFLRQKLNLPTERWTDIERSAHDRAFVVAGAMQADLLDGLRQAVDRAVSAESTLADFRRDFLATVEKQGWKDFTGDDRATQGRTGGRGLAWRTRTIYQTNIAASYAAGRWQQLNDPDLLAARPYWRYVHSDFVGNPRPRHKAWGDSGLTLRHDHPFWKTHFPPNGWGCRCSVKAVAKPKDGDDTAPPDGWDTRDGKGRLPGIDQGWDYAPGRTWHPDLDKYAYPIARRIVADNLNDGVFDRWHEKIARQVATERVKPEYDGIAAARLSGLLRTALTRGERYPVAVLDDRARQRLGVETQTVWLSDDTAIKQAIHRGDQDMPGGLWGRLQDAVESAEWVDDSTPNRLVYFHRDGDLMVAAIKVSATGRDAWLVSVRRGNERELRAGRNAGRIRQW